MAYFDKWKSTTGWRWSFITDNGRKLADSGEAYNNEADCDHAIGLAKSSSSLTFTVFKSGTQWYWRARAANNRIIADGAEGYHNESDCEHGKNVFRAQTPNATVRKRAA